ncbi:MAG: amidohydrolase family protein [Planctomycetes bacterium]|nr:amidohydrolase family protein [Planctomycetota bacterium]
MNPTDTSMPMRTALALGALLAAAAPVAAQERSIDIYYGSKPTEYQVAITGPATVESPSYAFRCARILPVTSPPIENGILLTRNGRIVAFGPADEVAIPDGYEVVDLGDRWCIPGLVELHCHVAGRGFDLNDTVHQTNPEMRTIDLVTMDHEALRNALAGGVTTTLFIPGSGSNMGGFGTLTKTWGRTPEEALIRFPGCLKIAQAGNPERRSGDLGLTPLGMNEGLRRTLETGREYHLAWEAWQRGEGPKPELKPNLEYLRGLFRHEYPIAVHTQIYQVALQTIRQLRGEFGLWTIIVHGTFDAYRLSEVAVEAGVPVANGPRQYHFDRGSGWGSNSRRESEFVGLAGEWFRGGMHGFTHSQRGVGIDGIAVNTDSPVIAQEQLSLQCAMAVRLGLPDEVGLRAMTINPARFIRIDDRVGSIEVGKDADLAFYSGDPIDPRSFVEATVVNGNIAYRRDPRRPRF